MSFLFGMSRKVDSKVLWNIVSGKYAKPREEDRIVMFLDMNKSTQIAEELGGIRYFEFVNEFFTDITPSILKAEGQIYRYVGDEIVVTWPMSKHFKCKNSIKTYFLAKNELKRLKEKYMSRYQIIPSFKAVFHYGKVIVGEIGDVKSQVVLHGKMMYVTGLIEKQCHIMGKSILVSSTLMEKVSLPKLYKAEKQGTLKTHDANIDLYAIAERENFNLT
jgi:adenylate cyclase